MAPSLPISLEVIVARDLDECEELQKDAERLVESSRRLYNSSALPVLLLSGLELRRSTGIQKGKYSTDKSVGDQRLA